MKFEVGRGPATDLSNEIPTSFDAAARLAGHGAGRGDGADAGWRSRSARSSSARRTAAGRSTARPGTTSMASDYTSVLANPRLGQLEVWDFVNKSGGWFHPIHVHLVDFRILSRNSNGRRSPTSGARRTWPTSARARRSGVVMKFGPHAGRT